MVSLLLFAMVCSFLLPTAMTILKTRPSKETSRVYQEIYEHSELLRHKSIPVNFKDERIQSFHYQGGIQICATNKLEEKCIF